MIKQSKLRKSRSLQRMRRHHRVRDKIRGTAQRPRLVVFRSLKNIEGQLVMTTLVHFGSGSPHYRKNSQGLAQK
ncbi:MAG: hypothetical protein Ct9H300mP15_26950 [Gemmatimonadota bacterium]|nr:MAG: hypothetical protein Ct9H300mP15_26950 [Gemmatimonadota bacterium]